MKPKSRNWCNGLDALLFTMIINYARNGLFLVLFLINGPAFAQMHENPSDESSIMIEWDKDRPLTWNDYPFRRFKREGKMAITSVKHSVTGYIRKGLPEFDIKVLFVANDSWTSDTTDIQLLHHERLHFDIGELYRRKIKQRIKELQKTGEKRASIYRAEVKIILKDFNSYSKLYDSESKNGNAKPEQIRWENVVWSELQRLQK